MPTTFIDANGAQWTVAQFKMLAKYYAEQQGIPADGLIALLARESAWDPNAVSPAGAQGLAQFMPATAAEWEVDPFSPISAVSGAARYLKWLRSQTTNWAAALAAYNWGIGNVSRNVGPDGRLNIDAPPVPDETARYVRALAPAFGESPDGRTRDTGVSSVLPLALLALAFFAWRASS